MYADLLTSEKIAFRTLDQYIAGSILLLDLDHAEAKISAVLDEFKMWFRFNRPASCHPLDNFDVDVMRHREDHWHDVLWLFRAHRFADALTEARDIVGA